MSPAGKRGGSGGRSPKGGRPGRADSGARGAKPARGGPAKGGTGRGARGAGAPGPGGAKAPKGTRGSSAKPRSKAAEKAIEARRVKHAAASVRKADRRGGGAATAAKARRPERDDTRGPVRRSAPRGLGGEQIEGRQAVREALLAGRRRIREVLVAADQDDAVALQDIVDLALDVGVVVNEVSKARLLSEARTESPQGVIAKAAELDEVDLEDLVTAPSTSPPFLLAVDGVTDPGNLGALLRSAECAGVTGVVLPRHRAVHVTPTVTKAAAGAVEYLPMALVGGLPAAITRLRTLGVWVVGLDMGGDQPLFELPDAVATEPVCLVLGAEGRGLSRLVRQRCDAVASIPLRGQLSSLNVAAAGALACFEITRRRLGT